MSVILISTPSDLAANAYVDEPTATAYLQNSRLSTPEWDAALADTRKKALIWATTILESVVRWNGWQTVSTQRLKWPRSGVWKNEYILWDAHTIPYLLEQATAELALLLIRRDRTKEPAVLALGMSSLSIPGPIRIDIDPRNVPALIPPYIANLLRTMGTVDELGGTSGCVDLVRC